MPSVMMPLRASRNPPPLRAGPAQHLQSFIGAASRAGGETAAASTSVSEVVQRARSAIVCERRELRQSIREARLAAAEASRSDLIAASVPPISVDAASSSPPPAIGELLIQEHATRRLIRRLSASRQRGPRGNGRLGLPWDRTPFFHALGTSLVQKLPLYTYFSAMRCHASVARAARAAAEEAYGARRRGVLRECFLAIRGEARLHALVQELPRTLDRWYIRRTQCRVFRTLMINCIYRARSDRALRKMRLGRLCRGLSTWRWVVTSRRSHRGPHDTLLRIAGTTATEGVLHGLVAGGRCVDHSRDFDVDSLNSSSDSINTSTYGENVDVSDIMNADSPALAEVMRSLSREQAPPSRHLETLSAQAAAEAIPMTPAHPIDAASMGEVDSSSVSIEVPSSGDSARHGRERSHPLVSEQEEIVTRSRSTSSHSSSASPSSVASTNTSSTTTSSSSSSSADEDTSTSSGPHSSLPSSVLLAPPPASRDSSALTDITSTPPTSSATGEETSSPSGSSGSSSGPSPSSSASSSPSSSDGSASRSRANVSEAVEHLDVDVEAFEQSVEGSSSTSVLSMVGSPIPTEIMSSMADDSFFPSVPAIAHNRSHSEIPTSGASPAIIECNAQGGSLARIPSNQSLYDGASLPSTSLSCAPILSASSSTGPSSARTLRQLLGLEEEEGEETGQTGYENSERISCKNGDADVFIEDGISSVSGDILSDTKQAPNYVETKVFSSDPNKFSRLGEHLSYDRPDTEAATAEARAFAFLSVTTMLQSECQAGLVARGVEALGAWREVVRVLARQREERLRPVLARRRFKLLYRCFRVMYENTAHNQLLRRVFGRAIALFCERYERASSDFRLLRAMLRAWREAAGHRRWRREATAKDTLARAHRGTRLLSRCFGAWALAASRERRLAFVKQQYSSMLIKAIFVGWLVVAREQKELDRDVVLRFDARRSAAVFSAWKHYTKASIAYKVSRVHRICVVKYWDGWRTLGREIKLRAMVQGQAWRRRRLYRIFTTWASVHIDRVNKFRVLDRFQMRVRLYQLRSAVAVWEGWREERASARMGALLRKRHAAATYHHQMFMHRWSSAEYADLDAPFCPVPIDEQLLDKYVRPKSEVWERSHRGREDSAGGRGSGRGTKAIGATSSVVKHKVFCVTPPKPAFAVSRARTPSVSGATTGAALHPPRDLIVDRGVRLGFCNYRAETTVPYKRCIRAVLRAWSVHVKRRRRALLAGAYYRSHKNFKLLAASFHAWGARVPQLVCRSASWLHARAPDVMVTGLNLTAMGRKSQEDSPRLPHKAEAMMYLLPLPAVSLPPVPAPAPDYNAVITKLVFSRPKDGEKYK